jgi:hypothetical protein
VMRSARNSWNDVLTRAVASLAATIECLEHAADLQRILRSGDYAETPRVKHKVEWADAKEPMV